MAQGWDGTPWGREALAALRKSKCRQRVSRRSEWGLCAKGWLARVSVFARLATSAHRLLFLFPANSETQLYPVKRPKVCRATDGSRKKNRYSTIPESVHTVGAKSSKIEFAKGHNERINWSRPAHEYLDRNGLCKRHGRELDESGYALSFELAEQL